MISRWGPARIGYHLGLHPSTEHRELSRYGLARLTCLDRPTGRVIRRYEHEYPGDLVHVDIKKLGRIARPSHRVTGSRRNPSRVSAGSTCSSPLTIMPKLVHRHVSR